MKHFSWIIVMLSGTGCISVGQSLPMRAPVMVGPIDHIGGKPTPIAENAPDEAKFDRDHEMFLLVCEESGIPTFSITRPMTQKVIDGVEQAYATFAGRGQLGTLVPRVSEIGTGAWVYFFTGCYGHHYWWNVDGHVEAVK